MKHSEARQATGSYDKDADTRLVKAAYDFNLAFAAQFTAPDTTAPDTTSDDPAGGPSSAAIDGAVANERLASGWRVAGEWLTSG